MRDSRYRIREFGPVDFVAHAAILNRLTPDRPVTVEQLRFEDEFAQTPPMVHRSFAVDEVATGRMVAAAGTVTPPDGIGLGTFWAGAGVDPDHQGRGIGRDLADTVEAAARQLGAVRLWASARSDDPRAIRFLKQQGFVEKARHWQSRLDVAAAAARDDALGAHPLPEGIEFTTLAEEGADDEQVIDRVYSLAVAGMADVPRLAPYVAPTRDQIVGMMLRGPEFLPEAVFLARADDQYVGLSNLQAVGAEPGVLFQHLTATRREFRRRGIALELKRRAIRFAKKGGYRVVRTWNESLNAPMWAINERLGFRREREMIWAEKGLADRSRAAD